MNDENMLKTLKSSETLTKGWKQKIADNFHSWNALLHYTLTLSKWAKNFNVAHALKRLFTPALNILLKLFKVGL
jgi:hypothetical protein